MLRCFFFLFELRCKLCNSAKGFFVLPLRWILPIFLLYLMKIMETTFFSQNRKRYGRLYGGRPFRGVLYPRNRDRVPMRDSRERPEGINHRPGRTIYARWEPCPQSRAYSGHLGTPTPHRVGRCGRRIMGHVSFILIP